LMRMGHLFSTKFDQYFYSQHEILDNISSRYDVVELNRKASSTANYWETSNGNKFGIIANESQPFCQDCDRLRLDSKGNLFGCLSENQSVSALEISNDGQKMDEILREALSHKQPVKFVGSPMSMIGIGG